MWEDYTVYIDGSAFYNNHKDITRCGFSFVVVEENGAVGAIAAGRGFVRPDGER